MTFQRTHQPHAVYFAEHWADAWTLQQHVYCEGFTLVAGPDISECTLSFNYGIVQPANDLQYATRTPKEVNGWYVKVEVSQATDDDPEAGPVKFYGVIVETRDERYGHVTSQGSTVESGRQTFYCRGLEFLLQRKIVDSSFVRDTIGDEIEIGRAIAFNLGPGRDTDHFRHGNKDSTPGDRDAPVFAFDIGPPKATSTDQLWSVQDIITYLFHYHPPGDIDGTDQLNWTVADGGDAEILGKLFPMVHVHGKSVKEILNELIDRRRLVGYTIDVVGDDEKPKLNIFTFNATDITLPSGASIPANSNQQTLQVDQDLDIRSLLVSNDDATRFDLVIARGEPLGACFTVANPAGAAPYSDLVKDWDDTLVTAYNTGASASGSYASLHSIDKQAANQAFRADDVLHKVFRAFIIDPHWDGTAADGVTPQCPDPTKEDETEAPSSEASPFWYPGLRLLDRLPLRTDYDYTTVEDFETTSLTIDNSQPDYLRPFAVTKIGELYYRLDRPGQGVLTDDLLKTQGRVWAASLRMQDDCPGFFIDVHGAAQHVIAEDEFTPADQSDDDDDDAQIDWKDIACTIFCEFDQHVEGKYPSEPLTTDSDVVRELIIDVPNCRLDYLAPDTVVGVADDGTLITTDGGYVRDDRALLEDIARCAFAWYGQTRRAITVMQHDLVCSHTIGELITTIGIATATVEVNSVITKLAFDVRSGTVTIYTQYAELDIAARP